MTNYKAKISESLERWRKSFIWVYILLSMCFYLLLVFNGEKLLHAIAGPVSGSYDNYQYFYYFWLISAVSAPFSRLSANLFIVPNVVLLGNAFFKLTWYAFLNVLPATEMALLTLVILVLGILSFFVEKSVRKVITINLVSVLAVVSLAAQFACVPPLTWQEYQYQNGQKFEAQKDGYQRSSKQK